MSILPPHKRTLSLTGELTAHYTLSAFLIMLVSSMLMYWGLVDSFNRRNLRYLDSQIQSLSAMIVRGDSEDLKKEVMFEHTASEYIRHYERLIDANGRFLLETPTMGNVLPPEAFKTGDSRNPGVVQRLDNGNLYIMKTTVVRLPNGENQLLQVALEISQVEKIRAEYREQLLGVLLFGVFFCAAAGVYIVRRSLRPLREITETVQRITASNLNERISSTALPTEFEVLARSFDSMLDRLETSFKSISNYSANLAHELRTPIGIIMGEAEVTLLRPRSNEEYRQVIVSALEECQRLTRLIDSLMFLARFDKNEIQLKPEDVDLRELVSELWVYYDPLVGAHDLTFECSGALVVHGDRELLCRALGNLLHNAIVYNINGGRVTVEMHCNQDRSAEISVSDTGYGISPEEQPKIFDRFHQSSTDRQLSPMWPGLVLPIVKAVIELHGGTISVLSRPDNGTTFTLHFPPQAER